MKNLKPYLQSHSSGEDAVKRTTKNNVIAVKVKTFVGDRLQSIDFYSYKTNGKNTDLREDFPLSLGSNQSIEEIDANDY